MRMPHTIGENVRAHRDRLGLSTIELAKLMGLRSHTSITHIEKGRNVSVKMVARLATAMKVTPGDLDPNGEAYTIAKRKPKSAGRGNPLQKRQNGTDRVTVAPQSPDQAGAGMSIGGVFDVPDAELFRKVLSVYLDLDSHEERKAFLHHARNFRALQASSTKAKNNRR